MVGYSTQKYLKLINPIVEAKFSGENIFIIDVENILYIFDRKFNLITKTRLIKQNDARHIFCNAFSISCNNIAIPAGKILAWAVYDEKITATFKTNLHDKNIVFTRYCTNDNFLLSGGEDGKVYIYDVKTKATRYIFPSKPDYCAYGTFSAQNNFVFVSYFSKENILLNLRNDLSVSIEFKNPIELACFFDNDKKLFMADRDGNSIIYDCVKCQVIQQNAIFTQWISQVLLSPNEKYLIVGTRTNKMYLVDPFKNEIIKTLELEDNGITSMHIKEGVLLLSFTNSTIMTIDLENNKDTFLTHIELKEYDKAKMVLDSNYFLHLDDAFTRFKAGFDEVIIKAKELITKGKIEEALKEVEPYFDYPDCKHNLDLLFMQQDHIALFVESVEKKEILNAYAIAKKYPVIESLSIYQTLQKQWELSFSKARRILEEDPLRGKDKAKEILSIYERIPQRMDLVKRLIANSTIFVKADAFIKNQNFDEYFILVGQYSFLQDTLLYKRVENLAASIYKKAIDLYNENELQNSIKTFRTLLHFPYYTQRTLKEIEKINLIIQFESIVEKNNIQKAYSLAHENIFLSFMSSFEKLNAPFEKVLQKINGSVQSGNIKHACIELGFYLDVSELQTRIDNCLKIGYLKQLEDMDFTLAKRELILQRYNFLFGLDSILEAIFTKKGFQEEYAKFKIAPSKENIARYPDYL